MFPNIGDFWRRGTGMVFDNYRSKLANLHFFPRNQDTEAFHDMKCFTKEVKSILSFI